MSTLEGRGKGFQSAPNPDLQKGSEVRDGAELSTCSILLAVLHPHSQSAKPRLLSSRLLMSWFRL
jgi:hypothetical protein